MFIKEIKHVWVEKWNKRIFIDLRENQGLSFKHFGSTLENANFPIRRLKPGTSLLLLNLMFLSYFLPVFKIKDFAFPFQNDLLSMI